MHINTINGGIGELAVQQKFLSLGHVPFTSVVEGYLVDIMVEWDNKVHKIQVKTTERAINGVMTWDISHSGSKNTKTGYTAGTIDYFALYCIETGSLCLVPFEDAGSREITIRLDSYKGKRTKTMRFESDYKFENYVK